MNNYGNGRPVGIRKTVQLMVILTILAWATQTLFSQWGYGAEISAERFVPDRSAAGAATLEMRPEATVVGEDVKLKQICRWPKGDEPAFAPIAELIVARLGQKTPIRSLSVSAIKGLLHDAGVNLAAINFVGAVSCTVQRSDVQYDEGQALQEWISARQPEAASPPAAAAQDSSPDHMASDEASVARPAQPPTDDVLPPDTRTLRSMLVEELAGRLNLPAEQLQVTFSQKDLGTLNLAEPQFRFEISAASKAKKLGEVAWDVGIISGGVTSRPVTIRADARAWQDQLVMTRPLSHKQVIREEDVIERRALVNQLSVDALLARAQVVGQQASRELKPGTVMTARLVEPVPLVRPGQFVTVSLSYGEVKVTTVARAMDAGAFGQTIRVKNEATRDVYEVVVTGPQTAQMGGQGTDGKDGEARIASAGE